jgi:PilZ domain-containing protein
MTQSASSKASERRRFERVDIPFKARVRVYDTKGKLLGVIRQMGRGGIMVEPEREFKKDKKIKVVISDDSEKIRFQINTVVRYASSRHVGFEFLDLDANAAVDVGILIGKYYESEK